jgi:hypothetical protein
MRRPKLLIDFTAFVWRERYYPSPSLHGLGESHVLASNIVTSPFIFFLVFVCLVYQKDGICRLVVECESVPSFADVLSICLYILLFFHVEGDTQLVLYILIS